MTKALHTVQQDQTGTPFVIDLISGEGWPAMKLAIGGFGSAALVSAANPIPVIGPLTQTELAGMTLDVTGTVAAVGPLTLAQLDNTTVNVQGAVTAQGPLTDPELRAKAVTMAFERFIATDAAGLLRVSNPESVFDSQHQYNKSPLFWDDIISGTASSTHLPDKSSVRLTVGGTVGDKITRRTKRWFRYQPGKGQRPKMTFVFGAGVSGLIRRAGYFDDTNGVWFEQNGSNGVRFMLRSKVSGAVVETAYEQANWNIDPMDGTGPSGITLDPGQMQIADFPFQWLSVGPLVFGLSVGGRFIPCHLVDHANTMGVPFMTTGNLPLTYELENTNGLGGDFDVTCATVISEGGHDPLGVPFSAANTVARTTSGSTPLPLLSIRPKLLFESLVNRGGLRPVGLSVVTSSNLTYQLVLNGTLTGPTWTSIDADSIAEVEKAATALSGGKKLFAGVAASASGSSSDNVGSTINLSELVLTLNALGDTADVLTLLVTSHGGNATVAGAMNWLEEY